LPTQLFQYFVWKVFSRNASGWRGYFEWLRVIVRAPPRI
jgi:hypothetical protein